MSSAYKGFLQQAALFYEAKYPKLSAHFDSMSGNFTIDNKRRDQLINETRGPFAVPKTSFDRSIAGLQQQVANLVADNEKLAQDKEDF